jgi:lipopolysaccharide transport system ATP-binding protein
MEPVIDFNNVTKEYPLYHHIGSGIKDLIFHPKRAFQLLKGRKYLAIQDVSFTVGKGEAVALIGRNGAGKSTSLGLVAGVIKPTKGSVTTRGRVASMLELGGGFHPELTGRENIFLMPHFLGYAVKRCSSEWSASLNFPN